jgi:hypothetical protein
MGKYTWSRKYIHMYLYLLDRALADTSINEAEMNV